MDTLTREREKRARISRKKYKLTAKGKLAIKEHKQTNSYKEGRRRYNKAYREKHVEKFRAYRQKDEYKEKQKQYEIKHRYKKGVRESRNAIDLKYLCLSVYSSGSEPRCSHPDCTVYDIDMLCIDHIENNGAEEKRSGKIANGKLYRYLIKNDFPGGYQTLCANHNLKKEIERRKNVAAGKWGEKPPAGG